MDYSKFKSLQQDLTDDFDQLAAVQKRLMEKLNKFANGKTLKGNEIVGWLGEIYIKLIFSGNLADDSCEHDVDTDDGLRISVKTRKGRNSGWNNTSAIPKIDGDDCPTHLAFVNLKPNYQVDRIWLFTWKELHDRDRFKKHIVRGNLRSYIVRINEKEDISNLTFVAD